MDATSRALASARELREFTVSMLADRAGIKETTVRTILNRHRHLFESRTGDSGRRGGQPQVWSVRASADAELAVLVGGVAAKFSDHEPPLPESSDGGPSDAQLSVSGINRELVKAEDLDGFKPNLVAQEFLPHLVRRLLVATPGITSASVRAGDAIGFAGFDGRVEASVATPFVPEGDSVWELGTGKDPQDKANADLRKRTKDPGDVDPAATAFVVVSLRRFREKDTWTAKARAQTSWRDVRVLDSDDLYAWLEDIPQVHIWASEQMGLRPLDVVSLDRWWESWLLQTDPSLPPDLPLAGRESESQKLREMVNSRAEVLGVYAASREEAMAFIAASLLVNKADDKNFSGTPPITAVVVQDRRAWERLIESSKPAVLLPLFENPNIGMAVRNGHNVLIPMGSGDDRSEARLELPPLDRMAACDAFRRAEPTLELDVADRRAAHARRSLVSLRRTMAVNPVRKRPDWAQGAEAKIIAPLVLVGSWEAESSSDQSIVAEITGCQYEEIERALRLSDAEDPPLIRAGNRWQLTSPEDAWGLLSAVLTTADLNRWRSVAVRVLEESDPTAALSGEDRLMASVRGLQRKFSPALRSGLARSAALMASTDGSAPNGGSWSRHADELVRELLGELPDPRRWSSVEDVLPLLAEASPEVFLRAAARGVGGEGPPLRALFADAESSIWGSNSPHTGLLWALELLCWPEEYLAEACEVLAQLAEIDPGGRLSNRPAESLRRVLLPWYPQTSASLDMRTDIVRALVERHPTAGWRLLLGLLPQHFDSSHPSYRPLFRDWKSQASQVTFVERLTATERLVDVALEHLRKHVACWSDFVELLPNLPPGDLNRSLAAFESTDVSAVPMEVRLSTWRSFSEMISGHRQFPTAQWALPGEWVIKLEHAAAKWEPEELPQRHAKLFDWHPDLPGTDKFAHEEYEKGLGDTRQQVVMSVMAQSGFAGLTTLIEEAPVPGFVGLTLADVAGDAVIDTVLPLLAEDGPLGVAARGWVLRMSEIGGIAWINRMLGTATTLPEAQRVHLYLSLPSNPTLWEVIDREIAAVRDEYWKRTGIIGVGTDDVPELVKRLVEHRRPLTAVRLLALHLHRPGQEVPQSLIEMTLQAVAHPDADEPHQAGSLDYDLGLLLDRLEAGGASSEVLFKFEWLFFQVLQHTRPARTIFWTLAEQPQLFVDLVTAAFHAEGEAAKDDDKASANEVAKARQAYTVLREWRQPPGLTQDGSIDPHLLTDWVTAARTRLAEVGRLKIGDECLGQVLSGSQTGADGVWPSEPVRDLVEELDSESLVQGLSIGRFNSRGGTSRGLLDGGKQEEVLAAQYDGWAKKVMVRWPKTGRLLREMAQSYKILARQQDAISERWATDA